MHKSYISNFHLKSSRKNIHFFDRKKSFLIHDLLLHSLSLLHQIPPKLIHKVNEMSRLLQFSGTFFALAGRRRGVHLYVSLLDNAPNAKNSVKTHKFMNLCDFTEFLSLVKNEFQQNFSRSWVEDYQYQSSKVEINVLWIYFFPLTSFFFFWKQCKEKSMAMP